MVSIDQSKAESIWETEDNGNTIIRLTYESPQLVIAAGSSPPEYNFIISSVLKLYELYKNRVNLPVSCSLSEFLIHVDNLMHDNFKTVPDRKVNVRSHNYYYTTIFILHINVTCYNI